MTGLPDQVLGADAGSLDCGSEDAGSCDEDAPE